MPGIEEGEGKVKKLCLHLNKQTQLDCNMVQYILSTEIYPIHELSWLPIHQIVLPVPFDTQPETMKELNSLLYITSSQMKNEGRYVPEVPYRYRLRMEQEP